MVEVKIKEEAKWGVTSKVGSIDLEYGIHGRELEQELQKAQDTFLRDMELRGYVLYDVPDFANPVWMCDENDEPLAEYALDWEMKNAPVAGDGGVIAPTTPSNLEESGGMVEYRVMGVFWTKEKIVERLTSIQERKDREKAEKEPLHFAT